MRHIKITLKVSLWLTAALALTNCGKKDFNSASVSSTKGEVTTETTDPGPSDPGPTVTPPGPTPNPEGVADSDVLVALYPPSYLFLDGGATPSLADLSKTKTPLMKLAQNAVLAQYGSFLGCEPSYDVYRVKFERFSSLLRVDLQTWVAGIRANSVRVGSHAADYYCNKLELGEDFD